MQKTTHHKKLLILFIVLPFTMAAQTLTEQIQSKIQELQTLITQGESKGLDMHKEKLAIRTSEVFLFYSDWDEANVAINKNMFELVAAYQDNAQQLANDLPEWERGDIIKLLDNGIAYAEDLINGKVTRKEFVDFDWSTAEHNGDEITYNGQPVFLSDYTWKLATAGEHNLRDYYGQLDGFFISPAHVEDEEGTIKKWILNDLTSKESGTLGFNFINHKNVPQWAVDKYGDDFNLGKDVRYTEYDIDNPGAKEMMGMLFDGTVPYMAGQKYSELGYLLCNEPHFYTTKTGDKYDWASSTVTQYTIDKFRTWLSNKHASIADLNALWGSSFTSFNDVTIEIPIDNSEQGTAKWFDWVSFNQYRVTDWYTWMKNEIRKSDADAKVHIKIMPNLWSENKRGHGINLEQLTELSEFCGNDAGAAYNQMWGSTPEWQEHYAFEWREMSMSYDFMKSVSPEKGVINSESHYLSTVKSRDLYMNPMYARACYWLAYTQGLTVSQTWFWCRREDGSPKSETEKGYGGSNNQQPRVTNELESTVLDLNSYGEEVMAYQRQRKPLRIFHSETSALNKPAHMDDVFELYEDMVFEGVPIGFATENIITKQDNSLWDAILVYKTEFVKQSEFDALQSYLNNGGTVIIDEVSFKKDEYKRDLASSLSSGSGKLIYKSTVEAIHTAAMDQLDADSKPEITVEETNTGGHKGCIWKVIKNGAGNNLLSVVNVGKSNAELNITLKNASVGTACKDALSGVYVSHNPTLEPYEVFFVEVMDEEDLTTIGDGVRGKVETKVTLHPNPTSGQFYLEFSDMQHNTSVCIYNMSGSLIESKNYTSVNQITYSLPSYLAHGNYIVKVNNGNWVKSFKLLKK